MQLQTYTLLLLENPPQTQICPITLTPLAHHLSLFPISLRASPITQGAHEQIVHSLTAHTKQNRDFFVTALAVG